MFGGRSPLLFEGVLQHLDPPHQVLLQVLLAPPFALQEGDLRLQSSEETPSHDREKRP